MVFFLFIRCKINWNNTVIPLYRETKYSLECQILSFSDIFLHSYRYGKCLLVKINYNFIFDQMMKMISTIFSAVSLRFLKSFSKEKFVLTSPFWTLPMCRGSRYFWTWSRSLWKARKASCITSVGFMISLSHMRAK